MISFQLDPLKGAFVEDEVCPVDIIDEDPRLRLHQAYRRMAIEDSRIKVVEVNQTIFLGDGVVV